MTIKRLAGRSQRRPRVDTANAPAEQSAPGPWPDSEARGTMTGSCCHGETVAPIQRQFQFRNLSDDPRLNLRLAGILISGRGTD
jgi:hypothetical protein